MTFRCAVIVCCMSVLSTRAFAQTGGDECSNATQIQGAGSYTFTTTGATDSPSFGDEIGYIGTDVWFRWTAPATARTVISTCGTLFQSIVAVYPDACPTNQIWIALNDDAPGCGTSSRVDFNAVAGESYLILIGSVWGYDAVTNGTFTIAQNTNPSGGGETLTVTTVYDDTDFGGFQTASDLPGPDGKVSLREAVTAANNTPGGQTIAFAIPQADWYYGGNVAQILNEGGDVYIIDDDATIIDGTTQTTNIGDTNPDGPEIGFWSWNPNAGNSPNFIIRGNDCVLKGLLGPGLMGYSAWIQGDRNRVIGCVLNSNLQGSLVVSGNDNIIGGAQPGEGNALGINAGVGIRIEAGARNIVIGNTMTGRNYGVEIRAGATDTRIGGPAPGERNVINFVGRSGAEGFPVGTNIAVEASTGTIIENNFIGVTADGSAGRNNRATIGLGLVNAPGSIVRGNVISDIKVMGFNHYAGQLFGTALSITSSPGTLVAGNKIGTNAAGTTPIPNRRAVSVLSSNVTIGDANIIAYSDFAGVIVDATARGVEITANSIHSNGALAIDLLPNSGGDVALNDPGDADAGANNLQNYPALTSATTSGSTTSVNGFLSSRPNRAYRIEFFANSTCDPSGHGEGQLFLGSHTVTTSASGDAAIAATLPNSTPEGWVATATATDLTTSDTSEFAACTPVTQGQTAGCPGDINADAMCNGADLSVLLSQFGQAATGGTVTADINADGMVNAADLSVLLARFGTGC